MQVEGSNQNKSLTILCPMCGIQFEPSIGTVCEACTVAKTDITIGITKEAVVNFCRFCHRYLRPPWIHCERDSKQLLALLLKKVRGLNRTKIINAGFIWTEPHSKRIKVKITVEKQLNALTKIQQTFYTEFVEAYTQCDDCKKEFTPHTWGAVVQVRQHTEHKKTFYLIQQLIIKHNAFDRVLKVSEQDDGLNFYYKNTTHAKRLIDFLGVVLPITVKQSKQLISHDMNSNTFVYKYTFSVQIPKICRDDLVIIPKKLATELGGCCRLMICMKVAQTIGLMDLDSFNYISMSSAQYYYYQKDIQMLPLSKYKREFVILDSVKLDKKKHQQAKSQLNRNVEKHYMYTLTRKDQYQHFQIKAALGQIHCGSSVEGFDLKILNITQEIDNIQGVQDIVLVKRVRDKKKMRVFKLKRLQEQGVMVEQGAKKKKGKKEKAKQSDESFQEVLDDIQNDPKLRKEVKMYKNENFEKKMKHMTQEQLDDALGQIKISELLDDLKLDDKPNEYQNQAQGIDQLIKKMEKVTIEKSQ